MHDLCLAVAMLVFPDVPHPATDLTPHGHSYDPVSSELRCEFESGYSPDFRDGSMPILGYDYARVTVQLNDRANFGTMTIYVRDSLHAPWTLLAN